MLRFNRQVFALMLFLFFVGVTRPSWAASIAANVTTDLRVVTGEILPGPGQKPPCWEPGTITLTSDISNCHTLWTNPKDTDEPFYAINSFANGQPTSIAFEYEVQENTLYTISGWLASLYKALDGTITNVDFLINGITQSNAFVTGLGDLNPYSLNWYSGSNTKALFQMRTNSSIYDGGDWAGNTPDLAATPEPGSMLLLGSGFTAVGAAFRRRTKKEQRG